MSKLIVCRDGFLKKRMVIKFLLQSFRISIFSSELSSIQNWREMERIYRSYRHENRRKRIDLEKESVPRRVGSHVWNDSFNDSIQLPSRSTRPIFGSNGHSFPPWPKGPWKWKFQACRNWKKQTRGKVESCSQIQWKQSNRTRALLLQEMGKSWWSQLKILHL